MFPKFGFSRAKFLRFFFNKHEQKKSFDDRNLVSKLWNDVLNSFVWRVNGKRRKEI